MTTPPSANSSFTPVQHRDRVILMPCSAGSPRQWKPLIEMLPGYDAVSFDLAGHGSRARWHGAGPMSLMQEAGAIDAANPGGAPFHLVGHSYSGAVALRYALAHSSRLLSLTLVEPSAFHILKSAEPREASLLGEIRAVSGAVNRGVISGDYQGGMQTFIDYWGGAGSWLGLPDVKRTQLAGLAGHVAHHFWGLIEEPTALGDYARVEVPTLIISGTRSPAPSRAITRMLTEMMPNARHRTIANAGHMSPLTHPAEVNAHIRAHLDANRATVESRSRQNAA